MLQKIEIISDFTLSQIGSQNPKTNLLLSQVTSTNLIVKWSLF